MKNPSQLGHRLVNLPLSDDHGRVEKLVPNQLNGITESMQHNTTVPGM